MGKIIEFLSGSDENSAIKLYSLDDLNIITHYFIKSTAHICLAGHTLHISTNMICDVLI